MKLGSPLTAIPELFVLSVTLVKGTFVLSLHLFSLSVHASPRLDDARTSVWAFGQVVCSLPEVRRPHSRTPSLRGLLLIWQHRISRIPRGVVVFEN